MAVLAEYNVSSGIAYIQESDSYYDVKCNIEFFCKIITMLRGIYGSFRYESVGGNCIIVLFGGAP